MEKEFKYIDLDKDVLQYYEQIDIIEKNMSRIGRDLLCMRQLIWNMPDACLTNEYNDILDHLCGEFANAIDAMNNVEKPELYCIYKLQS